MITLIILSPVDVARDLAMEVRVFNFLILHDVAQAAIIDNALHLLTLRREHWARFNLGQCQMIQIPC